MYNMNLGNIMFNSILFAEDLCLFQNNEDKLQREISTLNKTGKD